MSDSDRNETVRGMFSGSVALLLLRLSAPIYASMLFWILYTLTDVYWISQINSNDPSIVAGVSLVIPIYMLAMALGNGLLVGVKSLVARAIGVGNQEVLDKVSMSGMTLAIFLSIVFLALGYQFSRELVMSLGARDDVYTHSHVYFLYVLPASALLFLFSVFNGIAQGEGGMKYVMHAMGLGVGLNLILDPLLIFGFDLGVKGAGLATSVSQLISLLYLMSVFLKGNMRVPLHFNMRVVHTGTMMEILRVGLPQGLGEVLVAFYLLSINWLVISIDTKAMTAFGFCARVDQVVLLSIAAVSAAVMTAVAQNAGRGNFTRVREIQKVSIRIGMSVVLLQALLLIITAPWIFSWFTDVEAVVRYAVTQTRIVELFYSLAVVTLTSQAFFLAIGHPWPAVNIQLLKLFGVSLPVALILGYFFDIGMYGVWVGMIAGETVGALLSAIWCFGTLDKLAAGTLRVASA